MTHLKVRDSLDGKKGASLTVTRKDGTTRYQLKAAAGLELGQTMLPEFARDAGWVWDAGVQLVKDNAAGAQVDGRTLSVGARGTLFGRSPVIVNSTLNLQTVRDRIEGTKDLGIRYSGTLVLEQQGILERGIAYSRSGPAHFIYPSIGLHFDRHSTDGTRGRLLGGNLGLSMAYYPGGFLWPVRIGAEAIRARDFGGSGDATERSSTFYGAGIEYAFVDPRKSNASVVPTIALKRTLGANFLTGEAETAKSVLAFTLKVN